MVGRIAHPLLFEAWFISCCAFPCTPAWTCIKPFSELMSLLTAANWEAACQAISRSSTEQCCPDWSANP